MQIDDLITSIQELEALVQNSQDYFQTEAQAQELLKLIPTPQEKGGLECKTRILLILSTSLQKRELLQEAQSIAEQALTLAEQAENKALMAKAWNILGNICFQLSDYPRALDYMDRALIVLEEQDDKASAAFVIGNIGNVYIHIAEYNRALEHYKKALEVHEKLGQKSGAARITGNIGSVFYSLADYPHALEYYIKALTSYEDIGQKSGAALVTGNIGNVYMLLSDYTRALEYYSKALSAHEELGEKSGYARITGNIGSVYMHLANYSLALQYYGKALQVHEELGEKSGAARIIGNIGSVYYSMSDYWPALEFFGKALATHEQLGERSIAALVSGNIGKVLAKRDFQGYDASKAEEYLLKAIELNETLGAKQNLCLNYEVLSELYEQEERWKEAHEYFKRYHEIEKEVQTEEAKKQSEQFDYERKAAEREKQIAVERATTQARLEEQQKLIHNVLPPGIAERLLQKETFIADQYSGVSILFMDLVNFTQLSARISPRQLIYLLNTIFSTADKVMECYGLEKIKTIGDAYMAVAGAPVHQENHTQRAALAAIDVVEAMNNLSIRIPGELGDTAWIQQVGEIQVRIGLHCGEAIGGVIGDKKFSFDLWGDAVNTASRMESNGVAGKIHVSEEFVQHLTQGNLTLRQAQYTAQTLSQRNLTQSVTKNLTQTLSQGEGFRISFPLGEGRDGVFIPRGEIEIKGKGRMRTYFLARG
jgi:class 3 adenylate cyclase